MRVEVRYKGERELRRGGIIMREGVERIARWVRIGHVRIFIECKGFISKENEKRREREWPVGVKPPSPSRVPET